MYKHAVDQGFAARCAEYGITNPQEVDYLMKQAQVLLAQEQQMAKQAAMTPGQAAGLGALLGGGLGAGAGYAYDPSWQSALAGGLGGAALGAGAGYGLTPTPPPTAQQIAQHLGTGLYDVGAQHVEGYKNLYNQMIAPGFVPMLKTLAPVLFDTAESAFKDNPKNQAVPKKQRAFGY